MRKKQDVEKCHSAEFGRLKAGHVTPYVTSLITNHLFERKNIHSSSFNASCNTHVSSRLGSGLVCASVTSAIADN